MVAARTAAAAAGPSRPRSRLATRGKAGDPWQLSVWSSSRRAPGRQNGRRQIVVPARRRVTGALVMGVGEHPRMVDQSDREQAGSENGSRSGKLSGAGVSEFLGRLFGQLSLTSWFPAAVLVGNGAVLLQMHADQSAALGPAVEALTDKPLGILIVVVFALVIATVVTQAFEFETIQLLEGYGWLRGPGRLLMVVRIRRHAAKLDKLWRRHQRVRQTAFMGVRQRLLDLGYPAEQLEVLDNDVFDAAQPGDVDPVVIEDARSIDWEDFLAADVRYELEELRHRLSAYPDPSRLLPTQLGNQMRSAEDEMPLGGGEDLEGFVIRHQDRLPAPMREEQHTYRSRLEMYCVMVLVFVVLAIGSVIALHGIVPAWVLGVVATSYLFAAWISYQAAVASARGMSTALREVGRFIEREQAEQEP